MSYLCIHVLNTVEEIKLCQGMLPVVGEKADSVKWWKNTQDHLVPSTSAYGNDPKKGQL